MAEEYGQYLAAHLSSKERMALLMGHMGSTVPIDFVVKVEGVEPDGAVLLKVYLRARESGEDLAEFDVIRPMYSGMAVILSLEMVPTMKVTFSGT